LQRLTYACDELQSNLPSELRARLEECVYVEPEIEGGLSRSIYPDVRVIEYPNRRSGSTRTEGGSTAMAEPIIVRGESEPATEAFIEIIDP
jgi:hypothetical protein